MQGLVILAFLTRALAPIDSAPVCYSLEFGAWTEGPPGQPAPAHVRLDTLPHYAGRLKLSSDEGPRIGMANWQRIGMDSLKLGWSDGFEAVVLLVRVRGDSLRGQAQRWTDVVGGPPSEATVRGARVACHRAPAG
jgi:hypothetical protein